MFHGHTLHECATTTPMLPPNALDNCTLLMPFLAVHKSYIARAHTRQLRFEAAMLVPVFTVNFFGNDDTSIYISNLISLKHLSQISRDKTVFEKAVANIHQRLGRYGRDRGARARKHTSSASTGGTKSV